MTHDMVERSARRATKAPDVLAQAQSLLASGRDVQAEVLLKEAVSANPLQIEARLQLIGLYASRRDIQAVRDTANQLPDFSEKTFQALKAIFGEFGEDSFYSNLFREISVPDANPIDKADGFLRCGQDVQAEAVLKKAIARNPKEAGPYLKLIDLYALRRDTVAALSVANRLPAISEGERQSLVRSFNKLGTDGLPQALLRVLLRNRTA